jgi:hypothetical protein
MAGVWVGHLSAALGKPARSRNPPTDAISEPIKAGPNINKAAKKAFKYGRETVWGDETIR